MPDPVDLRERRETLNGFGEALSRAFEFVATPTLFGAGGWLIDGWVGTAPVFTVVFAVFALCGMFVRMWYGYDAEMRRHEREAPWARR